MLGSWMCRKDVKWQHEQGSEMMFDSLVRENDIFLNEKDERFIKALIAGEPSRCEYVLPNPYFGDPSLIRDSVLKSR
jgi:hypothetical protein